MEFRKCFECVLCKRIEPGLTLAGETVGNYTLMCMATKERLEITECIKEERPIGLTKEEEVENLP
jgi:hypothetical protein